MHKVTDIEELRALTAPLRLAGQRIGFVPTMGNLHDGHLALVDEAFEHADCVLVSIFVNPMQFDRADDLDNYPRTLDEDMALLREKGVLAVFTPTPDLLYPEGLDSIARVEVPELGERLEGGSRPGHFTGVTTIVAKLFNIVQPDVAVFGEKDFQQLAIVRKMVSDLNMPVKVVALPTVRDADGLAKSSRNGYLNIHEREVAPKFHQILMTVQDQLLGGSKVFSSLQEQAVQALNAAGFKADYVEICNGHTLLPAQMDDEYLVVLGSAWLGKARLIDNIAFQLSQ